MVFTSKYGWFFRNSMRSMPLVASLVACLVTFNGLTTVSAVETSTEAGEKNVEFIWQKQPVSAWAQVVERSLEPAQSSTTDKSVKKTKKKKKAVRVENTVAQNLPSIREQWYAVYALGMYGAEAKSAVPVLLKRLATQSGSDDDVRACILASLGNIGDESAFPAILDAFDSEYPIMKRTAVTALGKFPKLLQREEETIAKMVTILQTRSDMEIPLASNCAVTLWSIGETEPVREWLDVALHSNRKDAYTRNFETYNALSAMITIVKRYGMETFAEHAVPLTEQLTTLVLKSTDTDIALAACEFLTCAGSVAVSTVSQAVTTQKNPRLIRVLAQIDAENVETQDLLLALLADEMQPLEVRLAAMRGLKFLPLHRREEASAILVKILNADDVQMTLTNEARMVLNAIAEGT